MPRSDHGGKPRKFPRGRHDDKPRKKHDPDFWHRRDGSPRDTWAMILGAGFWLVVLLAAAKFVIG